MIPPQTMGTHSNPTDSRDLLFRSLLLKLGDISKETVQKKFWSMKKNKTKHNSVNKNSYQQGHWECRVHPSCFQPEARLGSAAPRLSSVTVGRREAIGHEEDRENTAVPSTEQAGRKGAETLLAGA